MKFEKFLKMTAGKAVIVDRGNNEKWLLFDGAMLRVPEGVNVIAALTMSESQFMTTIFNEYINENVSAAELTGAELDPPDASASKVIRIFTDNNGGQIGIQNKYFALIERGDDVATAYDEEYKNDEHPAALIILTGYGDNEEIEGIIFDDDYFSAKINERK